MTLKDEIDKLHEYSSVRDFQMAVQRIFQGMTEGTPVGPAEEMIAPTATTQATAYYAPLVTFAEEEK